MANPYYVYSGAFLPGILARAEAEQTEFTAVQQGFNLLAIQGTDTGAANAYVVATKGGQNGQYTDGMIVEFKAANANTGASTIAVDSGSTVNLTTSAGQSLASGAVSANTWYRAIYNSTYSAWTLIAPSSLTTTNATVSAGPPANKVGLVAAGGVANSVLPSDATFAIDQSIAPTWTGAHTFSAGVTFSSTVTFTGGLSLTGNASQYAATLNGNSGVGVSLGLLVKAGTNASDFAARVQNQSGATDYFRILGEGSALLGNPTGGGQGVGTLNATGLFINGVAVSTVVGANPTATIGLAVVNGSATTYLRSDGAPALSQAIAPTWTGAHTFTPSSAVTAVKINAAVNTIGLNVVGGTNTSNTWLTQITSGQGSGFSSGLLISAGTTSGDTALLVRSASGAVQFMSLAGDGSGSMGAGSTNSLSWDANGVFTFAAPASANPHVVKGAAGSNNPALKVQGSNTAGARGLLVLGGTSGSSDVCALFNDAGSTNNLFQIANVSGPGSAISALGPTAAALVDMTPDKGSFTLTGTNGPNLVCIWSRNGNQVTLYFPTGTVSTNGTTWTGSGLPAAIRPSRTIFKAFDPLTVEDNSVLGTFGIQLTNSTTVTFFAAQSSWSSNGFSNAGGVRGFSQPQAISYLLN